jgi:general secretion pathway protein C
LLYYRLVSTARQRRFSVAVILATLAVCAFFLAQGTTRVLASELLASDAAPKKRVTRAATGVPMFPRRRDPAIILRRNIFDSSRGDLTAEPLPEVAVGADGEPVAEWDPSKPPPKCTGSLRLVGAVVSPRDPEWSFAAIAGTSGGKTMLYREGSSVDGSRIVAVSSSSVVMAGSGGACQLLMFEEEQPGVAPPRLATKPATPATGRASARNAGLSDQELEEGIEKISDTRFNIQRSLVDKALANQGSLMKTARVIPHEENGRVVGVKLYGIRRNSLLGRLGVRNGDMLRTINGFDMTSPDTALEAYSRLRSADKLSLAVKRQNKEMTIEYNIE